MKRSRGAIIGADRPLYAQGYEPADQVAAYARGMPLAPAPWVDVTAGAGCVASTSDDMLPFLRALASAVEGKPAFGLSPDEARSFTTRFVPSDTPGMSYGNGLMHVGEAGRTYLHHTGGMLSFSSSFHIDVASGVGAFASSTLNAFPEYRPRLLTRFAVDALTDALGGRSLPSPPPLPTALENPGSYVGKYAGPAGTFEVRPGAPLAIVAEGVSAPLEPVGDEIFRTTPPGLSQLQHQVRSQQRTREARQLGAEPLCARGFASPASTLGPGTGEACGPLHQRQSLVRPGAGGRARRQALCRHRNADAKDRR